jgi:DNA repair protein RecO (recombination protein O)
MEWQDQGLVLSRRAYGETHAVVAVLTAAHGRTAGLVRGITGKRATGAWQVGNRLDLVWTARLDDQLGHWRGELSAAHAARAMNDPVALAILDAATALLDATLPERDPHPGLFAATDNLLAAPAPSHYLSWELQLLADLGFGLDLGACAVTGAAEDLTHISPRTGRAVSSAAAGPWRDRLLPLAPALRDPQHADAAAIGAALAVTGHFLAPQLLRPHQGLPAARYRLLDRLNGPATRS